MAGEQIQIPVAISADFGATQQAKLKQQMESALNNVQIKIADIKSGRSTGDLNALVAQQSKLQALPKALDQISLASVKSTKAIIDGTKAAKDADAAMQSFGARTGFATARLAAYLIPATAVFNITRALGVAARDVVEFSSDITKLTQILNDNRDAAQRLSEQVLKIGTSYGVSGKELLKVSTSLAQGGLKFRDPKDVINTTNELAKTQLVGTFGDLTENTQGLITVLNQFNLSANKTSEVLETVNTVAKSFSISTTDIFKAVGSAGAAFNLAGGSFKQFAALTGGLKGLTGLGGEEIGSELNTFIQKSFQPDQAALLSRLTKGRSASGNIVETFKGIADNTQGLTSQQLGSTLRGLTDSRSNKTLVTLIQDLQKASTGGSQLTNVLGELDKNQGTFNKDANEGLKDLDKQLASIASRFEEVFAKISQDKGIQQLVESFANLAKSSADVLEKVAPLLPLLIQIGTVVAGIGLAKGLPNLAGGFFRFANKGFLNGNTAAPESVKSSLTGLKVDPNQKLAEDALAVQTKEAIRAAGLAVRPKPDTFSESEIASVKAKFSKVDLVNQTANQARLAQQNQSLATPIEQQVPTSIIPPRRGLSRQFAGVQLTGLERKFANFTTDELRQFGQETGGRTSQTDLILELKRRAQNPTGRTYGPTFGPNPRPFIPSTGPVFAPGNISNETFNIRNVQRAIDSGDLSKISTSSLFQFGSRFGVGPGHPVIDELNSRAGVTPPEFRPSSLHPGTFPPQSSILGGGINFTDPSRGGLRTNLTSQDVKNLSGLGVNARRFDSGTLRVPFTDQEPLSRFALSRNQQQFIQSQRSIRGRLFNGDASNTGEQLGTTVALQSSLQAETAILRKSLSSYTKILQEGGASEELIINSTAELRQAILTNVKSLNALSAEQNELTVALEAEQEASLSKSLTKFSTPNNFNVPTFGQNARKDLSRLDLTPEIKKAVGQAAPFALAIGGQAASNYFNSKISNLGSNGKLNGDFRDTINSNNANNILSEASAGAGTGALIGSFVPGIGTAIGTGVGAGVGGLHAFLSNEFGNDTRNKLLDIASQNNTIQGAAPALAEILNQRTGEIRPTVQGFLNTDQGKNIRQTILNEALTTSGQIAKNNPNLSLGQIEGQTRQQLAGQLKDQFKQVGFGDKEATLAAQGVISEALHGSAKDIQDSAKAFRELGSQGNLLAIEFSKAKQGIQEFANNFRDSTRELGRRNVNTQVGLQLSEQAGNLAFGKQSTFQVPEGFAQALSENLFKSVRDLGTDSRKVLPGIQRFGGGILNSNQQAVFADLGAIQNSLSGVNTGIIRGLGGDALNKATSLASGQAATTAFGQLLHNLTPGLQTEEGINKFNSIKTQFAEKVSTPEGLAAFNQDREGFINSFLHEINTTGDFLNIANEKLKQFNLGITTALQPLQRLAETQNLINQNNSQIFNIRLGQAQRGPVVGSTPSQVLGGLNDLLGGVSSDTLSGNALSSATSRLNAAQLNSQKTLKDLGLTDFDGNAISNLSNENQQKVIAVNGELISAQTEYSKVVIDSTQALQGLKSRFETITGVLDRIGQSERGLSGLSTADRFSFRRNLQGGLNTFGGGLDQLARGGILSPEQIGNNPDLFNSVAKQFSSVPQSIGERYINALQQAGEAQLSDGLTGTNAAALIRQGIGQNILGQTAAGAPTTNKQNQLFGQQKADFKAIVVLEGTQADNLSSINTNLKAVIDILNGKPQGANGPHVSPTTPTTINTNFKFDGSINITGLEDASKDARTKGAAIFVLEEFVKHLDQSDPYQAQTANAMKQAIETVKGNDGKKK